MILMMRLRTTSQKYVRTEVVETRYRITRKRCSTQPNRQKEKRAQGATCSLDDLAQTMAARANIFHACGSIPPLLGAASGAPGAASDAKLEPRGRTVLSLRRRASVESDGTFPPAPSQFGCQAVRVSLARKIIRSKRKKEHEEGFGLAPPPPEGMASVPLASAL